MVVCLVFTVIYQYLLNSAFGPLFRYLPITLEGMWFATHCQLFLGPSNLLPTLMMIDDADLRCSIDEAVIRDEAFARAQGKYFPALLPLSLFILRPFSICPTVEKLTLTSLVEKRWTLDENEQEGDNIHDILEERQRRSEEESRRAEEIEMKEIEARKTRGRLDPRSLGKVVPGTVTQLVSERGSWAARSRNERARDMPRNQQHRRHPHSRKPTDLEAQKTGGDRIGEALFSGTYFEVPECNFRVLF